MCTHFFFFFSASLCVSPSLLTGGWMNERGVDSWRSGGAAEITLLTTVTSARSHTHSLRPVLMEASALFLGAAARFISVPSVSWDGDTDAAGCN